jgi:hypothetical protein
MGKGIFIKKIWEENGAYSGPLFLPVINDFRVSKRV